MYPKINKRSKMSGQIREKFNNDENNYNNHIMTQKNNNGHRDEFFLRKEHEEYKRKLTELKAINIHRLL